MNRMEATFRAKRTKGEKILVSYFPLCDTAMGDQVAWAKKYFRNGTTVLEMGLPCEDPCLDGAVVRASMERALKEHTMDDAFAVIARLREACPDNILQIMCYFEIVDKMGSKAFAKRCSESGADAVLSPNIPAERIAELDEALGEYGIFHLRFAPYHLTEAVMADLEQNAKGYIFLQAVDGATGAQVTTSKQVGVNVKLLKDLGIETPVVAGFGISNPQQVREVLDMGADGVIVGSAIVSAILEGKGEAFIAQLGEAVR